MSNGQIDRVIQGAEELFIQAGIKSVTMDDIARHLGMSKKTIYLFFTDKNELVTTLVKKKIKEDEEKINKIMDGAPNVIDELIDMMTCSEEILSKVNPIVIHELQKYHPEAWNIFMTFKSGFLVEKLEQLLTKGIDQGFVRPDIDTRILARMRVQQVEMGFNQQIFPNDQFSLWKVHSQLMEHFNYGICTVKGHKLLNAHKNINND